MKCLFVSTLILQPSAYFAGQRSWLLSPHRRATCQPTEWGHCTAPSFWQVSSEAFAFLAGSDCLLFLSADPPQHVLPQLCPHVWSGDQAALPEQEVNTGYQSNIATSVTSAVKLLHKMPDLDETMKECNSCVTEIWREKFLLLAFFVFLGALSHQLTLRWISDRPENRQLPPATYLALLVSECIPLSVAEPPK